MIRVLLVDDHEMVRAGLRALLGAVGGIAVVGEASTGDEAIAEAVRLEPDVVLMDLRLREGSGVEACREIAVRCRATRVLFLTSYPDELAKVSTVLAGAAGYLLKDIGGASLAEAIRAAAEGRLVVDPAIAGAVAERMRAVPALSRQECRVLELVVQGMTNREIGTQLGLSERTVRNYLSNAFQKLGVSRRSQAAVVFAQGGASGTSRQES